MKEDEEIDKDSGYKGSSDGGDANTSAMSCDDSLIEKEPLHVLDNNAESKSTVLKEEFHEELKMDEKIVINGEQEMDFTITREIFTEAKSSLFMYESPASEKRLKRDNSFGQSNSRLSQSSVIKYNFMSSIIL